LRTIFAETSQFADGLAVQLTGASVAELANTGGGFFSTISVAADIPQIPSPRILGHEIYARVEGLTHGMGFVLFMKDEYLNQLESYAVGYENTASLNLATVNFTISGFPKD
jgi:hypothetical protein